MAPHFRDLDITHKNRGVWLVKVPKYIDQRWKKAAAGVEVGKLKITRNPNAKVEVALTLSESILNIDDKEAIPKKHNLDITPVSRQSLGVFSEVSGAHNVDENISDPGRILFEGKVAQRLECRPPIGDKQYMTMKLESIKKAQQPTRTVIQVDRVFNGFKPVAIHQHLKEQAEKKKTEGKRSRDDKGAVLEMLFKAFSKHQYYTMKDLVLITKQPVTYLKEILKEVCNHNLKSPHKNMWELKPEYRHFQNEEKITTDGETEQLAS